MISDKYKCIFVHIPKCAGESISFAVDCFTSKFDKERGIWVQHATAEEIRKYYSTKNQWNNYFKFAVVRNPFDRIFSSFNWFYRFEKKSKLKTKLRFKMYVLRKNQYTALLDPNLIHDFRNKYHHVKPSYEYIYDKNDNLLVDYVCKLENINKDWKNMCKKINIPIKLAHRNIGRCNKENYRKYYDEEMIEFIKKNYKKDLEIFKYKF